MDKILVIGGGDLAKQINHHLSNDPGVEVVGFVDDTIANGEKKFNQNCLGDLKDIPQLFNQKVFDKLIIGIGYNHLKFRQDLSIKLSSYSFYTFIHKDSSVDKSAQLGNGVFISPGVVLDQNVVIGNNVFIYNSVTVSHDSIIGDNCFLSPCSAIAGFVKVGNNCNIGINTTIIDNIRITGNTRTGGGSVIIKDILISGLYVGNPARFVK